jgi:hypothetical protein
MGRTVEQPQLEIDFNSIKNAMNFITVYHDDEDTLFLRPQEPRPAVSYDWDGEVWLRLNPYNGEIVGFEIDDFESVFLQKYPEIANAWKEVKPLCHRKKKSLPQETNWEAFLIIILEFLQTLLRDNPQQARLTLNH